MDSEVPPDDSGEFALMDSAGAAAAPRFCKKCGTQLDETRLACATCDSKAPVERDTHRPIDFGIPSPSGVKSAIWLYAVFLLTMTPLFFVNSVEAVMIISLIDSIVVLFWCTAQRVVITPILQTPSLKWCGLGVLLGGGTFLIATLCVELAVTALDLPQEYYTPEFLDNGYGWWVIILIICVQPAVIEELAFRGVIFGGLSKILSVRETIIVTAMMFMMIHLSGLSFAHLFIIGLALGWLRARTGTIWPCMAMHFTHNLLCVATEPLFMD